MEPPVSVELDADVDTATADELPPTAQDVLVDALAIEQVLHEALSAVEYEVVRKHYWDGLTIAEAAEAIGITRESAVRAHTRARRKLLGPLSEAFEAS